MSILCLFGYNVQWNAGEKMETEFNISKRLKELREKKGMTTNKLAQLSGYSRSYIKDIEDGIKTNPSIQALQRICDVLEISISEFLNPDPEVEVDASDKLDLILQKLNRLETEIKSEIKRLDQKIDIGLKDLHDGQVLILQKIKKIEETQDRISKQIEHLSFRSVEHEREIRELKTAK